MRGSRGDLADGAAVRSAVQTLTERIGGFAAQGFIVQRMATPGISCVLRSVEDPVFGPVVSFSIAGPSTDLLGDVAHRIAPLREVEITELLDAPRASSMLRGYRGMAPADRAALIDLVARVSALTDDLPTVSHLDLNPVNATDGGVDILGAQIRVRPATRRENPTKRTLR